MRCIGDDEGRQLCHGRIIVHFFSSEIMVDVPRDTLWSQEISQERGKGA